MRYAAYICQMFCLLYLVIWTLCIVYGLLLLFLHMNKVANIQERIITRWVRTSGLFWNILLIETMLLFLCLFLESRVSFAHICNNMFFFFFLYRNFRSLDTWRYMLFELLFFFIRNWNTYNSKIIQTYNYKYVQNVLKIRNRIHIIIKFSLFFIALIKGIIIVYTCLCFCRRTIRDYRPDVSLITLVNGKIY